MRVEIDYEALKDNMTLSRNGDVIKGRKNLLEQMKQGNHFTCLVSGYRGSGKSTLIKEITNDLKSETTLDSSKLILFQNIDKYETYSIFLRKIIRELYLNIVNDDQMKQKILDNNNILFQKIESLYENTYLDKKSMFLDINTHTESIDMKNILNNKSFVEITKLIGPFISPLLTTTLAFFNILPEFVNYLVVFVSIIYLCFKNIEIITKKGKSREKKMEVSKQTLYDDEIAEYQLFTIFKELKKSKIDILIIFDEMDKIEDSEKLKKVLSELKHFLLFQDTSTIVISGQYLLYESLQSNFEDDGLLSSFFSIKLHVPLQSRADCHRQLKSKMIIENLNEEENQLLDLYLDSLLYKSKRVSRNMFNYISDNLVWDGKNEKPYIEIMEDRKEVYKNYKTILDIITEFEEDVILKQIDEKGLSDMYVYHLFIWISRMEIKRNKKFTLNEILRINEMEKVNSNWGVTDDKKNILYLFIVLLEDKRLIEQIDNEGDIFDTHEIYYRWIYTDSKLSNKVSIWQFVEEFIDFEQILNKIRSNYKFKNYQKKSSARENLVELHKRELVNKKSFESISELINLRNSLVHTKDKHDLNKDIPIIDSINSLRNEEHMLVENFIKKILDYIVERVSNAEIIEKITSPEEEILEENFNDYILKVEDSIQLNINIKKNIDTNYYFYENKTSTEQSTNKKKEIEVIIYYGYRKYSSELKLDNNKLLLIDCSNFIEKQIYSELMSAINQ